MTKTKVFIYGSCVSRDTFEHFDPSRFELVQYVARQSALSAYTRPVTLMEPPRMASDFQSRMVAGDYASSLQALIPQYADSTDLLLIDLIDERLGAYVLPDGSVVTRSPELIESGAEKNLPTGSQLLAFGTETHYQYWSQGIAAVATLIDTYMPHAAVALLNIPWASVSDAGGRTPSSFGINAAEANPLFDEYARVAEQTLGALRITVPADAAVSGSNHPWNDAPFHYTSSVYQTIVRELTGTEARDPWEPKKPAAQDSDSPPAANTNLHSGPSAEPSKTQLAPNEPTRLSHGPDLVVGGVRHGGAEWIIQQFRKYPDVLIADNRGSNFFNQPKKCNDPEKIKEYEQAYRATDSSTLRIDYSPDYFWSTPGGPFGPRKPTAAPQLGKMLPSNSRFLVVIRNPVDRAIDAYWNAFAQGQIASPAGLLHAPRALGIVDHGFYHRHLQHLSRFLNRDRIEVLVWDELEDDPGAAVEKLRTSLGISPKTQEKRRIRIDPPTPTAPSWLTPLMRNNPITSVEIAALFQIYQGPLKALAKNHGIQVPEHWFDQKSTLERLCE